MRGRTNDYILVLHATRTSQIAAAEDLLHLTPHPAIPTMDGVIVKVTCMSGISATVDEAPNSAALDPNLLSSVVATGIRLKFRACLQLFLRKVPSDVEGEQ